MPLKNVQRFAKIVDASFKDAGRARRLSRSPEAQQEIVKDRKSALSQFTTVKDALKDRERIAKAKGAAKSGTAATAKNATPSRKNATPSRKNAPPKNGGR